MQKIKEMKMINNRDCWKYSLNTENVLTESLQWEKYLLQCNVHGIDFLFSSTVDCRRVFAKIYLRWITASSFASTYHLDQQSVSMVQISFR